jgi:hydroxyacylglutathione hydrolase
MRKASLMTENLNVEWIHGSPNCTAPEPSIQIHQFDPDTFVLRQSKCSEPGTATHPGPSFEAPFMYLLIGSSRALLLDTGASRSPALFPLASTVGKLLQDHASARGKSVVPLQIAHSHSHPDHFAGDGQFAGEADAIPPNLNSVKSRLGLPNWPEGRATIELGDRTLDVIPIPGHESSHIAIYDRSTRILLTGDTLYPGLLVVNDWPAYVASIARLHAFVGAHPVSFILGAHIEMTNQSGRWFGLGKLFQPGEHILQLSSAHLAELHSALEAIGLQPRTERHADFIIYPADDTLPELQP